MKVGDLIKDINDGELGLVVAEGKGWSFPESRLPSYLVRWPSVSALCEIGSDAIDAGLIEIVYEA
jgi:hypothetical protein